MVVAALTEAASAMRSLSGARSISTSQVLRNPIAHSRLSEDPSVVKITAVTAHLLNGSKALARPKQFIAPQHAPRFISALRPALKDQRILVPVETTIESLANDRYFIR